MHKGAGTRRAPGRAFHVGNVLISFRGSQNTPSSRRPRSTEAPPFRPRFGRRSTLCAASRDRGSRGTGRGMLGAVPAAREPDRGGPAEAEGGEAQAEVIAASRLGLRVAIELVVDCLDATNPRCGGAGRLRAAPNHVEYRTAADPSAASAVVGPSVRALLAKMASGGKENLPAAGGAASAGPKAPASQPPSSSAAAQAYASLIASPNAQGGAGSPAVPGSQPAQKAPPRPRAKNAVSTIWGTENLRMVDMEAPARPPSSAQPPPSQAGPNTTAAAVKDYLFQGLFSTTPTAGSSAALQPAGAPPVVNAPEPEGEEDEDIEDELENLQRFTNYEPRLPYGKPHPDPLVEASSLANCPPPPITYTPLMFTNPEARAKAIDSGALSNVQLESIVYACQRHEQKCPDGKTTAGFVVGDGAGVGKGRTIAGIIYENALRGRKKALWVSVSADLHVDAQRDLDDIGADHIAVTNIAKLSYESIRNFDEGVLFSTYSSLVAKRSQKTTLRASGKKLLSSRLEQVIDWLGEDFDGPIVFDESHKAKNLVPPSSKTPAAPNADEDDKIDLSNRADVILELINEAGRGAGQQVKTVTKKGGATQTGIVIAALQERLKKARVVYVSATGVSEVRNLAYMSRMGLWGPGTAFPSGFRDFYDQISKRGEGAMECLALDMKSMGSYLSRTLSYHGATFEVVKVTMDPALLDYDSAAQLWLDARDVFDSWIANNSSQLQSRKITLMQRMYWAAHQVSVFWVRGVVKADSNRRYSDSSGNEPDPF
ncbi:P-loop containing NTP hydrolase pore-1-domain-containing protein [Hyaloraphidium curvatum]|nr:P-loop containing NTP hydrolase pore-1-domain-containing protein [Hyaloraphidium curvatum]